MKPWQYALGIWVVGTLGLAFDATGYPIYAIPCLLLGAFGFLKLIQKRQEQ